MANRLKPGRPKKAKPDGLDYGPVFRQIRVAELLGWDYWVEGERVRYQAPAGFEEKDAPWLAQTELGRLYARGTIGEDAYRAGRGFQAACWRAFGAPFARAIDYTKLPDGGGYEEMEAGAAQRFVVKAKRHVQDRAGLEGKQMIERLCQYDQAVPVEDVVGRVTLDAAMGALVRFMG